MTSIDLILDKDSYSVGENVKGTFRLTHGEHVFGRFVGFAVNAKLILQAIGEETTTVNKKSEINVDPNTGQPSKPFTINTYKAKNTFFEKDLSSELESLGTPADDGYLRIDVGIKEVPFEFAIYNNNKELFETYDGNSAHIKYYLNAKVDKQYHLFDPQKQPPFKVVKKSSIELNPDKVAATVTRENFKLDLEAEKDIYLRGDTIKGKVTLKNPLKKDINNLEIGTYGIEKTIAENVENQSVVEQYTQPINGNWTAGDSQIFELKIALNAKASYKAKYSEYYWQIYSRVDVSSELSEDFFAAQTITIM